MNFIAQSAVCATVVWVTLILDFVCASRFEIINYKRIHSDNVVWEATFYASCLCDCRKYCLMTDNCTAISATRTGKKALICLPTEVYKPYKYLVWPQGDGDYLVTRTYIKTGWVQWFWSQTKVTDISESSVVSACQAEGGVPAAVSTSDDYDHITYVSRRGVARNGSAIALYGSANPTWYGGMPLFPEVRDASIIGDPGWGECFLFNPNTTYEHASCDQDEPKRSLCQFDKETWLSAVGARM